MKSWRSGRRLRSHRYSAWVCQPDLAPDQTERFQSDPMWPHPRHAAEVPRGLDLVHIVRWPHAGRVQATQCASRGHVEIGNRGDPAGVVDEPGVRARV